MERFSYYSLDEPGMEHVEYGSYGLPLFSHGHERSFRSGPQPDLTSLSLVSAATEDFESLPGQPLSMHNGSWLPGPQTFDATATTSSSTFTPDELSACETTSPFPSPTPSGHQDMATNEYPPSAWNTLHHQNAAVGGYNSPIDSRNCPKWHPVWLSEPHKTSFHDYMPDHTLHISRERDSSAVKDPVGRKRRRDSKKSQRLAPLKTCSPVLAPDFCSGPTRQAAGDAIHSTAPTHLPLSPPPSAIIPRLDHPFSDGYAQIAPSSSAIDPAGGGRPESLAKTTPPRNRHNLIEQKYRHRLNAQFEQLLDALPSSISDARGHSPPMAELCSTFSTARRGKNRHQEQRTQEGRGESVAKGEREQGQERKVSKGEVLDRARLYIQSLEEEHRRLMEQQRDLEQLWGAYASRGNGEDAGGEA